MLAWPSISETTFGFTFLESKSVAHVCRRSWKRNSGKPARLSMGLKRRAVTCWRESGEPLSEAKMRPFSRHTPPARSISPNWCSRWLLRASKIAAGGHAVEVEDFDFAYALYAGDPSNGSSRRVASFREGRIGYREWATRSAPACDVLRGVSTTWSVVCGWHASGARAVGEWRFTYTLS
jgi:hypothetical protein